MTQLSNFVVLMLSLMCVWQTGCAYHSGFGDRRVPGGFDKVAIPVFKNLTPETGIEVPFTNAIIREIERSQLARVSSVEESQVTLEGTVTGISYLYGTQVTATPDNYLPKDTVLTTDYRIIVSTKLELKRNSDRKLIWSGDFQGERTYLAPKIGSENLNSANALYNHSAHYQNVSLMAPDIMQEAHDRMTENF